MVMMRVIIILCCITIWPSEEHVLTSFKGIDQYAANIIKYGDFLWDSFGDNIVEQHFYCEKLRNARLFSIKSEEFSPRKNNKTEHHANIQIQVLQEINHLHTKFGTRKFVINKQEFIIKSFTCLDPNNGVAKWTVIYSAVLASGFLFEQRPKGKTPRKIEAVVDDEAYHLNSPRTYLETLFYESSRLAQDNSLCHLGSNLQYRICVLCADVMHQTIYPSNNSDISIDHSPLNHYHPISVRDSCPILNITILNMTDNVFYIRQSLLHCHVSIQQTEYKFYISRNMKPLHSHHVFIIQDIDKFGLIVKHDLYVPLLGERLPKINHLWGRTENTLSTPLIPCWLKPCVLF